MKGRSNTSYLQLFLNNFPLTFKNESSNSFNSSENILMDATDVIEELANAELSDEIPIEEAKKIPAKIGARTYNITGTSDKLKIFVIADSGDLGPNQLAVAELMNEVVDKNPEQKPDLILIVGDFIYKKQKDLQSIRDHTKAYENPKLVHICQVPVFYAMGNHEYEYYRYRNPMAESGKNAALNVLGAMYAKKGTEELFSQSTIDIKDLNKHNMPYYYYSLKFPNGTHLVVADSNTWVLDDFQRQMNISENNQVDFITNIFRHEAQDKSTTILAEHNTHYVSTMRAWEGDSDIYLDNETKAKVNTLLGLPIDSNLHHQQLAATQKKLHPDVRIGGHEHYMRVLYKKIDAGDSKPVMEITAGGGGSKSPQSQIDLSNYDDQSYFGPNYGFFVLSTDASKPGEVEVDAYTNQSVNGQLKPLVDKHLRFNSNRKDPIRPRADDDIEEIRKILMPAWDTYRDFIQENLKRHNGHFLFDNNKPLKSMSHFYNNMIHTTKDINLMYEIINHFNQAEECPPNITVEKIGGYIAEMSNQTSDHSLYLDLIRNLVNALVAHPDEPQFHTLRIHINSLLQVIFNAPINDSKTNDKIYDILNHTLVTFRTKINDTETDEYEEATINSKSKVNPILEENKVCLHTTIIEALKNLQEIVKPYHLLKHPHP